MIKIADRFRPFSHAPGAMCMIPQSSWAACAYPTEITVFCDEQNYILNLRLTGPVEGFTLQQDLERNVVSVFGRAKEGYFNFEISHRESIIVITLKRGDSIPYEFNGKSGVLKRNDFLEIQVEKAFPLIHIERLSLGMNKKLDWDLVSKRGDLREILPSLFFLGQKVSSRTVPLPHQELLTFIKNHFHHILLPKRIVEKRLGLVSEDILPEISFSAIIFQTYSLIRALFIDETENEVSILPNLPKEFVFGRILGLKTSKAIIDIEWSKRKLHKVRITPTQDGALQIKWPHNINTFRQKGCPRKKGVISSFKDEIQLTAGQVIFLDRFQV